MLFNMIISILYRQTYLHLKIVERHRKYIYIEFITPILKIELQKQNKIDCLKKKKEPLIVLVSGSLIWFGSWLDSLMGTTMVDITNYGFWGFLYTC